MMNNRSYPVLLNLCRSPEAEHGWTVLDYQTEAKSFHLFTFMHRKPLAPLIRVHEHKINSLQHFIAECMPISRCEW